MALQTVMLIASFGIKEVNLADDQLIVAIIAFNCFRFPGRFVSWVSSKVDIRTLIGCLVVWMGVCVYAYSLVNDVNGFFVAAGVIGFMMGGTQSLNTFEDAAERWRTTRHYFSFYEVLKGGLIISIFSWGYIEGFTGSMRSSILALIIFFVVSIALLFDPEGPAHLTLIFRQKRVLEQFKFDPPILLAPSFCGVVRCGIAAAVPSQLQARGICAAFPRASMTGRTLLAQREFVRFSSMKSVWPLTSTTNQLYISAATDSNCARAVDVKSLR